MPMSAPPPDPRAHDPVAAVPRRASADGPTDDAVPEIALHAGLGWRAILVENDEGRWLSLGALLALGLMLGIGAAWAWWPEDTLTFAAMTGLNLLIGAPAGMAYGYAAGLGNFPVVACGMLVDTIQVLVVYPLFVLSCTHWLAPTWLAAPLARLRARAERGGQTVRRFGIAGLFLFVFVPFWMTGPVAGAVIGYLLGLRSRTTIAVVLAGSYAAIGAYALFLVQIEAWAAAYGRYAAFAAIVTIAVVASVLQRWRRPAGARSPRRD